MRIAIYKPWKMIDFNEHADKGKGNAEMVNFIKIMSIHHHEIYILSPTNFTEVNFPDKGQFTNIFPAKLDNYSMLTDKFDFFFMFNGVFQKPKEGKQGEPGENEVLSKIKADKKILLATDLGIVEKSHKNPESKYDLILWQAFENRPKWKYGNLEKLYLYNEVPFRMGFNDRLNRAIFFGSRRKRVKEILEFVQRPHVKWYGGNLTSMFGLANKCNQDQFEKEFVKSRYAVIISDPLYYEHGWITQRYYEACLYGAVNIISNKFDKYYNLVPKDDWRRVTEYMDMLKKMHFTKEDEWAPIQQNQFKEIEPWLDGTKFYKYLYDIITNI